MSKFRGFTVVINHVFNSVKSLLKGLKKIAGNNNAAKEFLWDSKISSIKKNIHYIYIQYYLF